MLIFYLRIVKIVKKIVILLKKLLFLDIIAKKFNDLEKYIFLTLIACALFYEM